MSLHSKRLVLRPFEKSSEQDMEALYRLLADETVNTFLPWFPVQSREEALVFYQERLENEPYFFAVCRKEDNLPIGYLKADTGEGHDLGYALRREYWRQGLMSEAGETLLPFLKKEGFPYLTATHDRNNPASGGVMKRLGMVYCYSYQEQWQPKDFPVIFRLYQLNLDGQAGRVFSRYWEQSDVHFIEENV